jgi:hypothetical protein
MDVLHAKKGPAVAPLPEIVATIAQQLSQEQRHWLQRLLADPSRFGEVEVTVHHTFQEHADQVVAGLLAEVGRRQALEDPSKKSR